MALVPISRAISVRCQVTAAFSRRLYASLSAARPRSSPFVGRFTSPRSLSPALSHALRLSLGGASRMSIRCRVNRSGDSAYSPLNSSSNFSDRPPTEMAPLFPGCDYEHWLIVMENPGGEGATKQQMIDCYIQTLAKVVGRFIKPIETLSRLMADTAILSFLRL
ncbi:Multiple organellar RNA editing factor 2 [Nymphaea thermarum]|nr:Multiple organellar RNA editing factor 2 [Nymphaea thermarum]